MSENQFQHPQSQSSQPAGDQVFTQSDISVQIEAISQKLDAYINRRINWNTDIIGLFETVSVVPTLIPTKPYDQIKFYSNSTTYRLYMYDQINQVWRYASLT